MILGSSLRTLLEEEQSLLDSRFLVSIRKIGAIEKRICTGCLVGRCRPFTVS